jgi:hypothetical protein
LVIRKKKEERRKGEGRREKEEGNEHAMESISVLHYL